MNYPFDPHSATGAVMEHLAAGKEITPKLAWNLFGVSYLPAVIHYLKSHGVAIDSDWIIVPTRRGKTRVKRYFLQVCGNDDDGIYDVHYQESSKSSRSSKGVIS
ncbi:MAG TPA: helix-turn-helix domain-containing protein [Thiotrichales bacterium]|nr:helix-turn-helix domain-containing protein [Thiotrichales bacterium]